MLSALAVLLDAAPEPLPRCFRCLAEIPEAGEGGLWTSGTEIQRSYIAICADCIGQAVRATLAAAFVGDGQ